MPMIWWSERSPTSHLTSISWGSCWILRSPWGLARAVGGQPQTRPASSPHQPMTVSLSWILRRSQKGATFLSLSTNTSCSWFYLPALVAESSGTNWIPHTREGGASFRNNCYFQQRFSLPFGFSEISTAMVSLLISQRDWHGHTNNQRHFSSSLSPKSSVQTKKPTLFWGALFLECWVWASRTWSRLLSFKI